MDDSLHTSDSANGDDGSDAAAAATAAAATAVNTAVDVKKENGSNSRDIASLTLDVRSQ